ncbi:MAG: short chain dehydrogenase [Burkholderiales bacterium PBB3]|nr:MAG: short chain dehydrogenase [Burkholderiales bacterium PBB3]
MNVLVIGASRGIGLELVRQYVEAGHRVLATARDAAGLERLRAAGAQALLLDVANPASVSGLSWQLDGEEINLALYVAGVFALQDAKAPPTQQAFDAMMHTNVLGAMQVIPQVAPCVAAAQGQFVFLSSDMGQVGGVAANIAWLYRTSKAALNMAVVAAQCDYPQAQFILMHPGWVKTDMGTANAPLQVQDSVTAMRQTLSATPRPAGPLTAQNVPYLAWDGRLFPSW